MDLSKFTDQLPDQLSKSLDGLEFPAEKEQVVQQAESNNADSHIVTALKKIPPGVYDSTNDVVEKAKGMLG